MRSSTVYEYEEDPSNRSFFSELVSSTSDIQFIRDGQYIIARDFLSLKVWDIRFERQPVEVCARARSVICPSCTALRDWVNIHFLRRHGVKCYPLRLRSFLCTAFSQSTCAIYTRLTAFSISSCAPAAVTECMLFSFSAPFLALSVLFSE